MPRVLHILNRMTIGGHSLIINTLMKHMPANYEMKLIVGRPEPQENIAEDFLQDLLHSTVEIPEMVRSISLKNDFQAYKKIKAVIEEFKPDIVHTHTSKPGAIGRIAAAHCKVPVILHTFHGHVFHSYFSPLKSQMIVQIERFLAGKSNQLIALSDQQKDELVNTYKIASANKVQIIRLGLQLDKFTEHLQEKRKVFRSSFQLDDDSIAIGIIGRLAPIKNLSFFVRAFHALLQSAKTIDKKLKAFIVGDGECRVQLELLCNELNLGFSSPEKPDYKQPVIFTSWRNDIDTVAAGIDIVALTSLNEGNPISLIEAQAASKPIVATNCGGVKDVVKDGETAFLSPVGDLQSFVANLERLVADETLRRTMGANGVKIAFEKFSYTELIRSTCSLYEQELALHKHSLS